MNYAAVDQAISAWADEHGLKLLAEFGGQERRFCYVTGGPQECFQVSIEPPEGAKVIVNASSIETIDDEELKASWSVSQEEVGSALNRALETIATWSARPKGPASW